MVEAMFYGGLFVGMCFTFVNVVTALRGGSVSGLNIIVMSAAWTVFVASLT